MKGNDVEFYSLQLHRYQNQESFQLPRLFISTPLKLLTIIKISGEF